MSLTSYRAAPPRDLWEGNLPQLSIPASGFWKKPDSLVITTLRMKISSVAVG
jgi:hypothetical protein